MTVTTTAPAGLSPDEAAAFHQRCIEFLDRHATGIHLDGDPDPRAEKRLRAAQAFQQALAEAGLAGLTYPRSMAGRGSPRSTTRSGASATPSTRS